jgi:hypothetical protein
VNKCAVNVLLLGRISGITGEELTALYVQLQYDETKRSARGFPSVLCRTARRKSPCIRKVLLPVVSAYVLLVFFYVPADDEISGEHVAGPDVKHFVACRCFASASEGRSNTT